MSLKEESEYTYSDKNSQWSLQASWAKQNHLFCNMAIKETCAALNENDVDFNVADFGAGIGTIAKIYRKKTGVSPLCIDIDSQHIQVLKKESFNTYTDLKDIPCNLNAIYSFHVLEHIQDDDSTLKVMFDKLDTGG
jgi:2-polyprenyl-3-methyl-5-hydroxy-6-metoxy-1,4-benzoquinol methylase